MQARRKSRIIELTILAIVLVLVLGVKLTDHYLSDNQEVKTQLEGQGQEADKASLQEEKKDSIVVHVTGAVKAEGVYELEKGSRLTDAIEEAGGLTEEADTDSVNLAQKVYDTQKIVIYKVGETPKEPFVNPIGEWTLQDLNEADAQRLMEIKGIGEQMARRILDHKKENGPFHSIDDLIQVKGIGEKKLASIKEVFESAKE